eukprot:TRINITY_DN4146_c0_g2_i1.p1 TRINITY_DN4146_c0_g2~~TRINITY_DN4146_c0_g2_i1.p1  ORF type:complete len:1311 (-),score=283.38 TRINITY_DN4146_c0_g2_i1:69-4001(-)
MAALARWEFERQEAKRLKRLAAVRGVVQTNRPPRPPGSHVSSRAPSHEGSPQISARARSREGSVHGSRPTSSCSTPVLWKPRARSASPGTRLQPLQHPASGGPKPSLRPPQQPASGYPAQSSESPQLGASHLLSPGRRQEDLRRQLNDSKAVGEELEDWYFAQKAADPSGRQSLPERREGNDCDYDAMIKHKKSRQAARSEPPKPRPQQRSPIPSAAAQRAPAHQRVSAHSRAEAPPSQPVVPRVESDPPLAPPGDGQVGGATAPQAENTDAPAPEVAPASKAGLGNAAAIQEWLAQANKKVHDLMAPSPVAVPSSQGAAAHHALDTEKAGSTEEPTAAPTAENSDKDSSEAGTIPPEEAKEAEEERLDEKEVLAASLTADVLANASEDPRASPEADPSDGETIPPDEAADAEEERLEERKILTASLTNELSKVQCGTTDCSEAIFDAMIEEYSRVAGNSLLGDRAGFMDSKDDNGLALNIAGLERLFEGVKDAPLYIGNRSVQRSLAASLAEWMHWWCSELKHGIAGSKGQSLLATSTDFWGCSVDIPYPWMKSLSHYLLWQLIHLMLAHRYKEAYNALVQPPLDATATETTLADNLAREIRAGTNVLFLQECTSSLLMKLQSSIGGQFEAFGELDATSFSCVVAASTLQPRRVELPGCQAEKFVAVAFDRLRCVVLCCHCPSGGVDAIPDRVREALREAAQAYPDVIVGGDTNVCPNHEGRPKESTRSYKENFDELLTVLAPRRSITEGMQNVAFSLGYGGYANTTKKKRWIGSAQLAKVGVDDCNPKDHIFLPPSMQASSSSLIPSTAEDYMSSRYPSDHLGVKCSVTEHDLALLTLNCGGATSTLEWYPNRTVAKDYIACVETAAGSMVRDIVDECKFREVLRCVLGLEEIRQPEPDTRDEGSGQGSSEKSPSDAGTVSPEEAAEAEERLEERKVLTASLDPETFAAHADPDAVSSEQVLDAAEEKYLVDNCEFKGAVPGVSFRRSKDMNDKIPGDLARWGTIVSGRVEDGWLKVSDLTAGEKFLPLKVNGATVLFKQDSAPLAAGGNPAKAVPDADKGDSEEAKEKSPLEREPINSAVPGSHSTDESAQNSAQEGSVVDKRPPDEIADSEDTNYLVDNSEFKGAVPGVSFRRSKDMNDKIPGDLARWGTIVSGRLEDGWLKVLDLKLGQKFLPQKVNGATVLFRQHNSPSAKQVDRVMEVAGLAGPQTAKNEEEGVCALPAEPPRTGGQGRRPRGTQLGQSLQSRSEVAEDDARNELEESVRSGQRRLGATCASYADDFEVAGSEEEQEEDDVDESIDCSEGSKE